MACCFNHFAGPLIIQHMQRIFIGQSGFTDEGSPQLRLTTSKQLPDEVLLYIHVLVEELAQYFLINIIADSHQRELEETGHRWRQCINGFTVLLEIDQDGPVGQLIQYVLRFGEAFLPDTAGFSRGKWFDRHQ